MKLILPNAIILLVFSVVLLTGCDNEPPKPHSVVINIVDIAEATGFNEQIKSRTEALRQQVSEEVKVLSDGLNKDFEEEIAVFGDTPTEEEEERIKILRRDLNKQLFQARNDGNTRLTEETTTLRDAFLDDVMAVAQSVAIERGARIVLKAMGVFWSDESVEITDEVIGRMTVVADTQSEDSEQKLDEHDAQ